MKITTTIRLNDINETVFYLIDKKSKRNYLIGTLLLSSMLVYEIYLKEIFNIAICLIALISEILSFIFLYKARKDVATKVFNKMYQDGSYELTAKLSKEYIRFSNDHFTKDIDIPYNEIDKIKQTKKHILIFLKNKSHFLLKKEDFDHEKFIKKIERKITC